MLTAYPHLGKKGLSNSKGVECTSHLSANAPGLGEGPLNGDTRSRNGKEVLHHTSKHQEVVAVTLQKLCIRWPAEGHYLRFQP